MSSSLVFVGLNDHCNVCGWYDRRESWVSHYFPPEKFKFFLRSGYIRYHDIDLSEVVDEIHTAVCKENRTKLKALNQKPHCLNRVRVKDLIDFCFDFLNRFLSQLIDQWKFEDDCGQLVLQIWLVWSTGSTDIHWECGYYVRAISLVSKLFSKDFSYDWENVMIKLHVIFRFIKYEVIEFIQFWFT